MTHIMNTSVNGSTSQEVEEDIIPKCAWNVRIGSPFLDLAPIFNLDGHFTWVSVSLITCPTARHVRESERDRERERHTQRLSRVGL